MSEEMWTEVVRKYSNRILQAILIIEQLCFPPRWQMENVEDDYRRYLGDNDCINILLKDKEQIIGYLLAVPHNSDMESLQKADPGYHNDDDRYYIWTVGVVPTHQGKGGLRLILNQLIKECLCRGIFHLSAHPRVNNGVSSTLQKVFKTTKVRRIAAWKYYHYEEPCDYLEMDIKRDNALSSLPSV